MFLVCTLFSFNTCTVSALERGLGYERQSAFFELGLQFGYDSNLYDSSSGVHSSYYYRPDFKLGINSGGDVIGLQAVYEFDSFVQKS